MSAPIDYSYVTCFRSLVGYNFVGQGNFETLESSKASATSETSRAASQIFRKNTAEGLAVVRYLYTVGTRGNPCGLKRLGGGWVGACGVGRSSSARTFNFAMYFLYFPWARLTHL